MKCVDCGFFGYRSGGKDIDGSAYLKNEFWECHTDERQDLDIDSYVSFSDDVEKWSVIGCFHHVWTLWGSNNEKEREKANKILTENRRCKYYFPYLSGYEPAGHNEMRRDKKNQRIWILVGVINAIAVLLAALITAILRA
jgi:hypothetical protein